MAENRPKSMQLLSPGLASSLGCSAQWCLSTAVQKHLSVQDILFHIFGPSSRPTRSFAPGLQQQVGVMTPTSLKPQ